jgi:hypothetical protein
MPVLNDEELHRGHLKERLDLASNIWSFFMWPSMPLTSKFLAGLIC